MRKVIASINMTLDGYCDHTSAIADEEVHDHFTNLLREAGVLLYGRITYQLMEFWPPLLEHPSGNKAMDDFAVAIDAVPKIVFSRTLDHVDWKTATIAKSSPEEVVRELRQQPGKDIFVGSPGMIDQLTQLQLIDEYQLCIHPVIAGKGLRLFKNTSDSIILKLLKTKTFGGGHIVAYYEPVKN